MTEQQIKAEHDRLRTILFDGAQVWFADWQWAAMDINEVWYFFREKPKFDTYYGVWRTDTLLRWLTKQECNSQPKTTLHWTDTLISRGEEK